MSKARTWTFGAVALMLVIIVAGWVLGISPIFDQISAANAQTTSIQTSNVSTQAQLGALKTQFDNISTLQAGLNTLRLSIPEEAAASTFINEVTGLATSDNVTVQSVTIADAVLYAAPVSSTTPETTDTPATPAPTATPGATVTPTVTSNGLVIIPVVVTVKGSLGDSQAFMKDLQTGTRLFVSSTLTLSSDAAGGNVTASLTGDIFTLQGSSDPSPTDPSAPVDQSTATPLPTGSATPTLTPTPTNTTSSSTGSGSGSGSGSGTTKPKKSTPTPPSTPNPVH